MVTVDSIFEYVVIMAGQGLVDKNILEIKNNLFLPILINCLEDYSKYVPHEAYFGIDNMTTDDKGDVDYSYTFPIETAPEWISRVTPTYGNSLLYLSNSSTKSTGTLCYWRYDKPILYLPYGGLFEIRAVYRFYIETRIEEITNPDGTITENEIKFIRWLSTKDTLLYKLVTARFMIALGRTRRTFDVSDNPVRFDAAQMVSEGLSMEASALKEMQTNEMKFYLAQT